MWLPDVNVLLCASQGQAPNYAVARQRLEAALGSGPSVVLHPGPRHAALLGALLIGAGTAGNLTTDAHIAAIAIEHGATVLSFDRDFARFAWHLPTPSCNTFPPPSGGDLLVDGIPLSRLTERRTATQASLELRCAIKANPMPAVVGLMAGPVNGIEAASPGELKVALEVGANLDDICPRVQAQLPQAALVIELGRYLVGEAGVYVTRIVDRKVSGGQVFMVTDRGLNHHLSASGNFGQVIRKNYAATLVTASGSLAEGGAREVASVVGPLCTPLDLLADRMHLPVAEAGDLAVIFQSGAYGASASPQAFLGHPVVTEVLV
jgi:hypothetical protein